MSALQTSITFTSSSAVTPAKLNQIISGATFTTDAVVGTTLTVVGGQLKVGTITSSEMGAGSVTTTALAASAVTSAKIADGNITTAKVADLAITAAKIADTTITFGKIATGALAGQTSMQNESASNLVTADTAKYAPGAAKAYGRFTIAGTARTLSGSHNITSVTRNSATSTTVTIADNMASDNFVVLASIFTDGTASDAGVVVTSQSAGGFTLRHPSEGSPFEKIGFVVYGALA